MTTISRRTLIKGAGAVAGASLVGAPAFAHIATAAAAEDYQVCIGHCRPLQSRGFVIVVRRGSHPPIDGPGRYMAPCAISAASWTKVRTALPVPPLGV